MSKTAINHKQYILFDLDGTVIDSIQGILNGLKYAYNKLDLGNPDDEFLKQFVGPSVAATFKRLYNLSDEEAGRYMDIFREYYSTKGLHECKIYDGIEELIINLKAQGKKVAIATKKPEVFALQIAKNLGLDSLFDAVCGSDHDDVTPEKGYVLLKAMRLLGATDNDEVLMIGDTKYDCIGAQIAEVDCLGVLYGYGISEDFEPYGDVVVGIAKDVAELDNLLLNK